MAAVLVLGGLGGGYAWVASHACSGQARATIIASPSTATILQGLAKDWAATGPAVNGTCAAVDVTARGSAEMAIALGTEWNPKTAGPAPDVWVPQSSAWVRRAAASAVAEPMIPDLQPSVARSPTVIAMPRQMAEALGWPKTKLTWQGLLDTFANGKGWAAYGKDWGPFRFGMSDPAESTAGLLALTAILDANDDSEVDAKEQENVLRLKNVMKLDAKSTAQILKTLDGGGQGGGAAVPAVSAFPAFEQDVLTHNLANPKVPLVAIYPTNGNIEADNPYLILTDRAPWVTAQRQAVAKAFLAYVRGPKGRAAMMAAGFRDSNRVPGPQITQAHGLSPDLNALPRAVLLPDAVSRTLATWTALTRPTNMLLVLDVSGSMKTVVPGTGKTRLALAKEAARQAVSLFASDARVGLWTFSTGQNGAKDYRVVVPLGALGDGTGDGRTRKQQMLDRIDALKAGGDTGLYDTIAAAHQEILKDYRKGATNLVVLLTDGRNDDTTGGLSLAQLRDQLHKTPKDRPVRLVTVAYGEDADFATLNRISMETGSRAFSSRDAFDINQVLLTAVFAGV